MPVPALGANVVWILATNSLLAVGIGAFSGMIYTPLYGRFSDAGNPAYVWYILAAHTIVGIGAIMLFQRLAGGFKAHED